MRLRPVSTVRGRRRRRATVVSLVVAVAVAVVAAAIVVLSGSGNEERTLVSNYVRAWSKRDYRAMYALLDEPSRRRISQPAFAGALRRAAATATATPHSFAVRRVGSFRHGVVPVVVVELTRLFGPLREAVAVPVTGTGRD